MENRKELENYGTVKIIENTFIKDVAIIEFMQSTFKDNRVINVCELENGNFIISVENVESSGRGNHSMMLSKESFFGIFSIITLFINKKGFEFNEEVKQSIQSGDVINYSCSKNLNV